MEQHFDYQWEFLEKNRKPTRDLSAWKSNYGPKVIDRDSQGKASKVEFNLLIDNPEVEVFITGTFNDWKQTPEELQDYRLQKDEHSVMGSITLENIPHKTEYKFLVVDRLQKKSFLIQDPAGTFFTDFGNGVFWDYEDPSCYKQKNNFINTFDRTTKILQTDLPGLVVHYANQEGTCAKDIDSHGLYRFIADSGVISEIKNLGFNTVQFLPFAQNIDGDNWKIRYLVPFQFAIQKNWGTPDDFAYMIDKFHENDIAIIADGVIGHLPHKDYEIFGQPCSVNGIHQWQKTPAPNGHERLLYLKEETPWGTMRPDTDNPFVRDFLISSLIHFMKYYKIDGFRVDNIDGIIRYGDNGEGEERPNGRVFLKELNSAIYSFNPAALMHFEAHYFYEDNAKLLVAPLNSSDRALGATAYNSSRMTYYFHTKYMFKASDETTVWKYKHIAEEKEWGKSNSTVADFHNHDAAAGLMEMRCTGAYAYNCMMESGPENHPHAIGKIKVMESIVSFATEGRTLDLLQTFLLQPGTFEHNSSIEWHHKNKETPKYLIEYKSQINKLLDNPAFHPINVNKRKFLNVDDKNKVLVIQRESNSEKYIIIINTSSWTLHNYKVGLSSGSKLQTVLNSENLFAENEAYTPTNSNNFELLDKEISIYALQPYQTIVLKEIK